MLCRENLVETSSLWQRQLPQGHVLRPTWSIQSQEARHLDKLDKLWAVEENLLEATDGFSQSGAPRGARCLSSTAPRLQRCEELEGDTPCSQHAGLGPC